MLSLSQLHRFNLEQLIWLEFCLFVFTFLVFLMSSTEEPNALKSIFCPSYYQESLGEEEGACGGILQSSGGFAVTAVIVFIFVLAGFCFVSFLSGFVCNEAIVR